MRKPQVYYVSKEMATESYSNAAKAFPIDNIRSKFWGAD